MLIRAIALAAAVALTTLLSGCANLAAPRYTSSADTVVALRDGAAGAVTVGAFTATQAGARTITCRAAGYIMPPDGVSFAEYIRRALIDELKLSNRYADGGAVQLAGNLDLIKLDSVDGFWHLTLTVKDGASHSVTVTEAYDYESSFVADAACNQSAQALMPAVQDLISKLVKTPEFRSMMGAQAATS